METVARFYKGEDAYLFRSFLESEGIAAHVFDEYVPQNHWLYTQATGGIRVVVSPDDIEAAGNIFKEYEERTFSGEPVVGAVKAWQVALLAAFAIGAPLMLFGRKLLGTKNGKP